MIAYKMLYISRVL